MKLCTQPKNRNNTINCLANFFLFFLRLMEMKILGGPCLSAVLQLLIMYRALCVPKAFQLQRSSCTPCTATAVRERRLAGTLQVCHTWLLSVCSLYLSPFPVTCSQLLRSVPLGISGAWCGEVHSLCVLPSPSPPGVLVEAPVFPAPPAQRYLLPDGLCNSSHY